MFSRILYGGRASILLSLASAILSLGVGLVIGLFCGFYGGKLDMLCTVASNIFQGIPGSCFMIAIAGIFGPSIKSLVLALVITSWAGFSRIVRAEVMQLKEEPFIEGLRCLGCSDSRLLLHHIIPNIVNKLLILFTIRVGRGILSIAGLSFLGLGVQPPTPDWSVMVSDAVLYYRSTEREYMEQTLRVGVITSTHGVRGEVKVFPTTDDAKRFKKLKHVMIDTGKELKPMEIEQVKFFKNMVIVKFKGFDNINDIEIYKNKDILITREDAVPLGPDENFIVDLIGLKVMTDEGEELGTLKDVLQTGANDVYVVEMTDGKELLLPAIKQCILNVDLEQQTMTVHVLDGLMDL